MQKVPKVMDLTDDQAHNRSSRKATATLRRQNPKSLCLTPTRRSQCWALRSSPWEKRLALRCLCDTSTTW